jgi:hypothetical protein
MAFFGRLRLHDDIRLSLRPLILRHKAAAFSESITGSARQNRGPTAKVAVQRR